MLNYKIEHYMFMTGTTIEAVIRLKNNYVHGEVLQELVTIFNEENNYAVPKLGQSFKIPVLL